MRPRKPYGQTRTVDQIFYLKRVPGTLTCDVLSNNSDVYRLDDRRVASYWLLIVFFSTSSIQTNGRLVS